MSYRNPQIIVDRSAEIYAQAVGQIGQIWGQGVQNYFENKKKKQADIDKQNKAYQLGINKTQLEYDNSFREATKDIKDESLYALIQEQGRLKLDGSEGQLGVIEMETQLKLNPDLTKDQRKEYRTKIDDYNRWEDKIVNLTGDVMADLEPLDNLSSSEIGVPGRVEFLGEGNEKFKNYVVGFALKNKKVPGVEAKKSADGNLLNFDISVNANDPVIKEFINKGALQIKEGDISKDGKINLKWSRDINTWDGRFLVDIAEGPDIMKSLETANLVDNGNITKSFMSGTDYKVEDIKGTNYQTITPKNYFDPSIITENETVQSEFEAYAYGQIVSQSIDEAVVSLRSNFGAEISRQEWTDMNASEREDFVVDLLNDKAIEEAKGSKLATQTEFYDTRNNKVVSPSQLKSLAKKAYGDNYKEGVSEKDYIKQNVADGALEIKYYTLGKSFERQKPKPEGTSNGELTAAERTQKSVEERAKKRVDAILSNPSEAIRAIIGEEGYTEAKNAEGEVIITLYPGTEDEDKFNMNRSNQVARLAKRLEKGEFGEDQTTDKVLFEIDNYIEARRKKRLP